jgi:hypothetical protein
MLTQFMESVPGIQIFGVAALMLFFALFLLLVIRAWCSDKQILKKMSYLPLDRTPSHGDEDHE